MKLFALALLLISSLSSISIQTKPDWKDVVTSEDHNKTWKTYYDASNIERKVGGIVRVWLKQLPVTKTEAEKQRIVNAMIQNRKLNNMSSKGYEKFAYSLTLVEFDCVGRQGRSVAIRDFDQSEKLLGSDAKEDFPFAPVREGSMSEVILEAVCK